MARPLEAARPTITILAGIVLLGVVLSLARAVLIPIALAVLLSFTLSPAVIALQRRGLSRVPAVLLVVATAILIVGGSMFAVSSQLSTLIQELPKHKDRLVQRIRDVQGEGPGPLAAVISLVEEFQRRQDNAAKGSDVKADIPYVRIAQSPSSLLQTLRDVAGSLVGFVGTIGLVIALTMAMLIKREDMRNRLIRLAGHGELTSTTRAIDEATRRISRYLLVQLAVNSAFGALYGLGLALIGVDYALLWAFLAFLIRFIPLIGTWLAGVLPFIFSLTSETWFQPIAVVVFTVLIGLAVNNVIEPLLVTRTTGVSTVGLVIAAAFWTWLWGLIGLVLSTPITVCLAVLGRFVPPLQFLDVLFGTDPALDPQEGYYQRLLARDESEASEILEAYLEEHTPAEMCDLVLIPALMRAKEDFNMGRLGQEDIDYIVAATTDLLSDMGFQRPAEGAARDGATLVVGCPAKDHVDELGLRLFAQIVAPEGKVQTLTTKAVAAEIIADVKNTKPEAALIAAIHPGGLARIRYLVKRLRTAFPKLRIDVGYWGLPLQESKLPQQLKALGASDVATTMAESFRLMADALAWPPEPPPSDRDEMETAGTGSGTRVAELAKSSGPARTP